MSSVEVNGVTIEYDERGEGEPLLLIMGLSGQLVDWPEEFCDRLAARGFRVIRFDNRDIGLSSEIDGDPPTRGALVRSHFLRRTPPSPYTIDDMAADAVGLVDELGIGSAHVVGVSMGGMIAQSVAINHAAHVTSLVSIMSHTGDRRRGRPKARLLAKLARQPTPTRDTAVDAGMFVYAHIAGEGADHVAARELLELSVARSFRPHGMARQTAAIAASPDRTADLGSVRAPTLVIHGLADALVRPAGGEATARAVPGSRLLMFPEMGHDLPKTRWDEMIDAIVHNAERSGAQFSPKT